MFSLKWEHVAKPIKAAMGGPRGEWPSVSESPHTAFVHSVLFSVRLLEQTHLIFYNHPVRSQGKLLLPTLRNISILL